MYRFILLVLLLAPSLVFAAGPIYKSTDDKGNVTYSAEPPAAGVQSEPIVVPPPPSAEEAQLAEEEARKAKVQADKLEAERKAREAEQAAAAASPTSSTVVVPYPVPVGEEVLVPAPARPVQLPARQPIRR